MYKSIVKYAILHLLLLTVVSAQVTVSIPDTSKETNKNIIIPIYVSDLTDRGVRSYKFKLQYDQSILKFRSVIDENTISDRWLWDIDSDLEDDGLEIKANGWFSLTGKGILLKLKFRIRGEEGYTDLNFDSFKFNSGKPEAKTVDGSFAIYSEKEISFTKQGEGEGRILIDGAKFNLPHEAKLIQGRSYTLKAEPSGNSVFAGWAGGLNSTENPIEFKVSDDEKIILKYNIKQHSVAVTINPESFGSIEGAGVYKHGDQAILNATPFGGKRFVGWSINGSIVEEDPEYRFIVTSNLNLNANFENLLYEINANVYPPESGIINGLGYYYYDEEAVLEACRNENWEFDFWSENGEFVSGDSIFSLIVNQDRELTANFTQITDLEISNIED